MLSADNLFLSLILLAMVIVLIVFCVVFVMYNKKSIQKITESMNDNYTKYKDELKEQNNELNKLLLKQLSEQSNCNISKGAAGKNLMNIFVNLKEAIKENCIISMNQIGAARIAIYLFHNGVRSTHGISFFKLSCICEKVAIGSGIREHMMEHTNVPVNLFDEMIEKLITYNRFIIMNNEETQDMAYKIFISADKINYAQLVTIYDIDNNMLGFVEVEIDRPYSKDEADKEKEILDELVKQLVPVLSYSDYISINPQ
jgi:hypothetical protein